MWQIISEYTGIVIMTVGVYFFSRIMLSKKKSISNIKFLVIIFLVSVIHYIINMYITGIIKTVIICCINMMFYKYIFKIKIRKSILLTFLYMIILILTELLELFFITKVIGIDINLCYETYAGSLFANLLVCIVFLILSIFIKSIFRRIVNAKIDNNKNIIVYMIITFLCIGMFFYIIISEFQKENLIILYIMCILILIAMLFSLIKQIISNNKIIYEYDNLLKIMTTYEFDIENERILRHEAKNELRVIKAKIIENQKSEDIIDYIDEIINDKYVVDKEKYAKFGYLPPNGIKGLFYFKVQEAEKTGIKVSIHISKKILKSKIYDLNIKEQRDFGRIIGVFLDNAIEASIGSKDKKLGIEAYTINGNEFELIISNTYNNKINIDMLGNKRFSTKDAKRGRGLLLVKRLIEHNKKFKIKTTINNNIYIQTITIIKK